MSDRKTAAPGTCGRCGAVLAGEKATLCNGCASIYRVAEMGAEDAAPETERAREAWRQYSGVARKARKAVDGNDYDAFMAGFRAALGATATEPPPFICRQCGNPLRANEGLHTFCAGGYVLGPSEEPEK